MDLSFSFMTAAFFSATLPIPAIFPWSSPSSLAHQTPLFDTDMFISPSRLEAWQRASELEIVSNRLQHYCIFFDFFFFVAALAPYFNYKRSTHFIACGSGSSKIWYVYFLVAHSYRHSQDLSISFLLFRSGFIGRCLTVLLSPFCSHVTAADRLTCWDRHQCLPDIRLCLFIFFVPPTNFSP